MERLFAASADEIQDLSVSEALVRIVSRVGNKMRKFFVTTEHLAVEIIEATIREAIPPIRLWLSSSVKVEYKSFV